MHPQSRAPRRNRPAVMKMDSPEELNEEDVTFDCQECGKDITLSGERRGHVEICPHCDSYVDVPTYAESLKGPRPKPIPSPQDDVTFACQECGKGITFPVERRGHVETCPHCRRYVDVPTYAESLLAAETKAAPAPTVAARVSRETRQTKPPAVDSTDSRSSTQLWIEVIAVLCLAYVPPLFSAIADVSVGRPGSSSFVRGELWQLVTVFRITMPLLVIMALSRDPWSMFGIVRPRWLLDIFGGVAIFLVARLAHHIVATLLPPATFGTWGQLHIVHMAKPEGIMEYFLISVPLAASCFSEELVMRGYLIARLERLLQSTLAAVLVSTALFASCHMYQGLYGVIGTITSGLIYAVSFCLCRRLWPVFLAHAIHNFMVLY